MTTSMQFRINQPAVISEVIDGEAIIVNLDSGAYYSLRDSGCAIWELVIQGVALPDVVATLSGQYGGSSTAIATAIQALVAELQVEQLIVPVDKPGSLAPLATPTKHQDGDRPLFQQPVLEKFTDMADLLLLDPIHEVEETGWPRAAAPRQSDSA
jgi:hypothetical protein